MELKTVLSPDQVIAQNSAIRKALKLICDDYTDYGFAYVTSKMQKELILWLQMVIVKRSMHTEHLTLHTRFFV